MYSPSGVRQRLFLAVLAVFWPKSVVYRATDLSEVCCEAAGSLALRGLSERILLANRARGLSEPSCEAITLNAAFLAKTAILLRTPLKTLGEWPKRPFLVGYRARDLSEVPCEAGR